MLKYRFLLLALTLSLIPLTLLAQPADPQKTRKSALPTGEEETVFISKGYSYEPAADGENSDLGLFMCGTRCNALSVDYLNITTPTGWRMLRTKENHEVDVSLKKLGLKGRCTCVVDEYKVIVNNIYMSK